MSWALEPTPAAEIARERRNAAITRRLSIIDLDIERRRRRRKGKQGPSIATLRVAEFNRLFLVRYRGRLLPDDDDGRDSAWVMINHLAMLANPELRIRDWLLRSAPWFDDEDMIARVRAKPHRWKADTLAKALNLPDAERTRLKLWTIGAVDLSKEQRAARRREKNRLAKEAKRRAAGAKPQAQSFSRSKPWEHEKISRAEWYRRQMRQLRVQHTSGSFYTGAEPVSPAQALDAGSPAGETDGRGQAPLRRPASLSAGAGGEMSSRTAITGDRTRSSAVSWAELFKLRDEIPAHIGIIRLPLLVFEFADSDDEQTCAAKSGDGREWQRGENEREEGFQDRVFSNIGAACNLVFLT